MKISETRGTLSTEAIQILLDTALARTKELNIKVHISIMDSSADLAGWITCAGAPRIAATTARWKSFTAVNTGMSTAEWKTYTASVPDEERRIVESIEGYISADGGLPIIEDGILLGGIGVSGASQEADEDVAQTAVRALKAQKASS